jgi:hypothetical protein
VGVPAFPLGVVCALAALGLYAWPASRPVLLADDFQILLRSWTWERAWVALWEPANEHAMPLGRLTTGGLVALGGGFSKLPWLCALQGPLALVAAMALGGLFVRRETGSSLYGLVAMALFGVSSVYQQAVVWFSSSFSILALDMLLLGLLAAQRWRQSGGWLSLGLCLFWCALAPAWFASGVLAGPLCCLYLLVPDDEQGQISLAALRRVFPLGRSVAASLVPLVGTGLFLAISLPRTAQAIMHLEHYDGRTALESFEPLTGLFYTGRSLVENLLVGIVGISNVTIPAYLVGMAWPLMAALLAFAWEGCPRGRRLMLLGCGLILTSYLLVYSARALWDYDRAQMNTATWSRYHLLPQLGLSMIVAGVLTRWRPVALTSRQGWCVLGLIAVLFVCQSPRVLLTYWTADHADQQAVLRQIEQVDAFCQTHRIPAVTAREVLPYLEIPSGYGRENGWSFLRGSDDPDPQLTPERVRELLLPGGVRNQDNQDTSENLFSSSPAATAQAPSSTLMGNSFEGTRSVLRIVSIFRTMSGCLAATLFFSPTSAARSYSSIRVLPRCMLRRTPFQSPRRRAC